MDKDLFMEWLDKTIDKVKNDTKEEHLDTECKIQLWRGFVLSLQEVKDQVESGKFDKIN